MPPKYDTDELLAGLVGGLQQISQNSDYVGTGTYSKPTANTQPAYINPNISIPRPSWGAQVGTSVGNFAVGAAKFVGGLAVDTTKQVYKASKFAGVTNPLTALPMAIGNYVVDKSLGNATITDLGKASKLEAGAQKITRGATAAYAAGNINKDQYSQALKEATDLHNEAIQIRNSSLNSAGMPTDAKDVWDIINGGIAIASYGTWGAIKGAAVKVAQSAFEQQMGRKFLLELMPSLINTKNYAGVAQLTTQAGGKLGLQTRLSAIVWQGIQATPGARVYAERVLAKLGNTPTTRNFVTNAMFETVVYAPIREANMNMAFDTVEEFRKGSYFTGDKMGAVPNAILLMSMALEGGPIGFLYKNFGRGGKALNVAMHGETTFLDSVMKHAGFEGGLPDAIKWIKQNAPKYAKDISPRLKSITATNLKGGAADKVAYNAAMAVMKDFPEGTLEHPGQVLAHMLEWQDIQELVTIETKGLYGGRAVVARFDRTAQALLAKGAQKAAGLKGITENAADLAEKIAIRKQAAIDYIRAEAKKSYWGQSDQVVNTMVKDIENINSDTVKDLIKQVKYVINNRDTATLAKGVKKELRDKVARAGYVIVVPENSTKFITKEMASDTVLSSKFVKVDDMVFEKAAESKPVFRQMGAALDKIGLGAGNSSALAYQTVRENALANFKGVITHNPNKVMSALQQYCDIPEGSTIWGHIKRRTVTDLRMMTTNEIKTALDGAKLYVTRSEAKAIRIGLLKAYQATPVQLKGFAEYLVGGAYAKVPTFKTYMRVMGALRYTYNPFFRLQEITESEILGQAMAGGKQPWLLGMGTIWPAGKKRLDDVVMKMEKKGILTGGDWWSNQFGEAAQDVILGRATANISKTQMRSLATVAERMAQKMNLKGGVDELIEKYPSDLADMIRPIIQYPSTGILNSNLAKAVNLAVFPARYNTKVTAMAVRALGQMPPAMQTITINKLWELDGWMRSPEGLAWQQDNADAIKLFKWLTPIGNIAWAYNLLITPTGKGFQSVTDLGLIGGLPFGVIGTILQNQGIVDVDAPYVSPDQGAIYAKKMPESMRARAAQALVDLLGSAFTYPGRTVGLPGKSQFLKDVASIPFGTTSKEWSVKNYTNEDLHSQFAKDQQKYLEQRYNALIGKEQTGSQANPYISQPVPNEMFNDYGPLSPKTTKLEIAQDKIDAKAAKAATAAAAKTAKAKRSKTVTFPSSLPQ